MADTTAVKQRVLVIVEGGVVQEIHASNSDIEVRIVEFDSSLDKADLAPYRGSEAKVLDGPWSFDAELIDECFEGPTTDQHQSAMKAA